MRMVPIEPSKFKMKFNLNDLINLVSDNLFATRIETANSIVRNHVMWSMGAGLTPVPLVDMAAVSAVQLNMIRNLCEKYDVEYSKSLGKSLITALIGSSVARVGASLVKGIPIVGFILGGVSMSVLSGATTFAIGQVFISHFEANGTMENFDVESWKKIFEEQFEIGKDFASRIKKERRSDGFPPNDKFSNSNTGSSSDTAGNRGNEVDPQAQKAKLMDNIITKLEKLNDLREKGIITDDEFLAKKQELLQQL